MEAPLRDITEPGLSRSTPSSAVAGEGFEVAFTAHFAVGDDVEPARSWARMARRVVPPCACSRYSGGTRHNSLARTRGGRRFGEFFAIDEPVRLSVGTDERRGNSFVVIRSALQGEQRIPSQRSSGPGGLAHKRSDGHIQEAENEAAPECGPPSVDFEAGHRTS